MGLLIPKRKLTEQGELHTQCGSFLLMIRVHPHHRRRANRSLEWAKETGCSLRRPKHLGLEGNTSQKRENYKKGA